MTVFLLGVGLLFLTLIVWGIYECISDYKTSKKNLLELTRSDSFMELDEELKEKKIKEHEHIIKNNKHALGVSFFYSLFISFLIFTISFALPYGANQSDFIQVWEENYAIPYIEEAYKKEKIRLDGLDWGVHGSTNQVSLFKDDSKENYKITFTSNRFDSPIDIVTVQLASIEAGKTPYITFREIQGDLGFGYKKGYLHEPILHLPSDYKIKTSK